MLWELYLKKRKPAVFLSAHQNLMHPQTSHTPAGWGCRSGQGGLRKGGGAECGCRKLCSAVGEEVRADS